MTDIQTQLAPLSADDFRQDQTRVCTIMAFLIGVDWQKCSFYYEQEEKLYEELQANQECVIIRCLCRIRTNLMLNYSETQNQMVYNLTNLDRQERYREDVKTLHKCGIDIIKVNYFVNLYLADINKLITCLSCRAVKKKKRSSLNQKTTSPIKAVIHIKCISIGSLLMKEIF